MNNLPRALGLRLYAVVNHQYPCRLSRPCPASVAPHVSEVGRPYLRVMDARRWRARVRECNSR